MGRPENELLSTHVDLDVWGAAEKQAHRSTLHRFRTGAVLTNGISIVGKGCSHISDVAVPRRSHHAEQHALETVYDTSGLTCVIVTLNRNGNFAHSSRPCAFCVKLLHDASIERVIYAERDNVGTWNVSNETLESLIEHAGIEDISATYARSMRVS